MCSVRPYLPKNTDNKPKLDIFSKEIFEIVISVTKTFLKNVQDYKFCLYAENSRKKRNVVISFNQECTWEKTFFYGYKYV